MLRRSFLYPIPVSRNTFLKLKFCRLQNSSGRMYNYLRSDNLKFWTSKWRLQCARPPNTWFVGPTPLTIINGSAEQLVQPFLHGLCMPHSPIHYTVLPHLLQKFAPCHGWYGPPSSTQFPEPTQLTTQMEPWLSQLFFHNTCSLQTDWPTDRMTTELNR